MSAPVHPVPGADGGDPLRPATPGLRSPQVPIQVPAGSTAAAAVSEAGLPTHGAPDAIVVVRDADGKLRDLSWVPDVDVEVTPVPVNTDDGRSVIRHSTAHVLAQAVQDLFPQAKLGIGPPITDGFYYDFDVAEPFTPEDLKALEKRMRQIVKEGQLFSRRIYESKEQARTEWAGEPYKLELVDDESGDAEIMEVGGDELTAYDNLNARNGERIWGDLCRGPHIPTTKHIPAFKLTRSSAAYWRGNQKNASLQRIYGTAWESQEALDRHLEMITEAQRRDHRKLGIELDLFSFPDEIGSGLAIFHPKGSIVRREMEEYSRRKHIEAGYQFVNTPHITKAQLFHTSGHLDWYAEGIFPPMHLDAEHNDDGTVRKPGQDYYLKPMNCPMHTLIFSSRGRSYRELPLRLFEFGTIYRYEKSGVVHGLTRARGFTMDDSHIFCTREQLHCELASLLRFVLDLLGDYGLEDFYLELSTKDPEKFVGSEEIWEEATAALAEVAENSTLPLVPDPGGAAFYGPKISVQVRDALGRSWQMSTIQVDFNFPERFALEYTSADGTRQRPVMIHRALFGSIERFFGILTEHYAGAFPAWLAPIQVVGIPVTGEHVSYLEEVAAQLKSCGVRTEVDVSDDRMAKKIVRHTNQKVPFMLLAGDRDVRTGSVSFRFGDRTQINGVARDSAVEAIVCWIVDRENDFPTAELVKVTGGE
ncbi:threonyl-tRNA synthetase [Mycobacterium leprae Kyoto-2]|uniref:Threonine--tRNA ligase n=3 Tax=Mycobacterium leprae TaxID=1769 RepID=SYT_MYCLE|nr:threonine--tRNA ligase [Mycobacterium leprae]B8ZUG9.1 RecName: Full=Threonine--tRNA ligase; AltName: Full=Threonyl-tRNA synthetase; Short=ThrRS [Mycobacterium leprae Br4923]O07151.1 RecName: Full=Threonine--tRNA ligase; AltName: Full=Threonyl-tRNA synthetase; Short=ThrRS [Mycobacterium leprae TN]AWV47361.1 threonine--tRNA ligase [Mycobacterium leprae]OAR20621.1 threonine--tRNA ligase [Mycobacterium leprae 3125609]CAB09620.1 ThrS [Mycobacterium leprae]CAC29964.1 threonyl-tRNA synthetase [My